MPPSTVRIGLLGCGVVGQGFLKLLKQRERLIREAVGAPLKVARIAVREPGKRWMKIGKRPGANGAGSAGSK